MFAFFLNALKLYHKMALSEVKPTLLLTVSVLCGPSLRTICLDSIRGGVTKFESEGF